MRVPGVLVAALIILAPGCDLGGKEEIGPPPAQVPDGMTPAMIQPNLTLTENASAQGVFANAGNRSLIADGHVWEIRHEATLVGIFQISTVKSKIDLKKSRDRDRVLAGVIPEASSRIVVSGVDVLMADTDDKVTYLWFGPTFFEVLQLRGTQIDAEGVLRQLLEHQQSLSVLGNGNEGS